MRCILGLYATALPFVACFSVRGTDYLVKTPGKGATSFPSSCQTNPIMFGDRLRSSSNSGSNSSSRDLAQRSCRTRRYAGNLDGGPANLDSSDDGPEDGGGEADAEIYASLRRRLEELEKTAPIAAEQQQVEEPQPPAAARAREREFTVPKEPPEDKNRARALLTIQSVGVISAALSFGTLALYWLAGAYFVHLGPREYPGSVSVRQGRASTTSGTTVERTATPPAAAGGGGGAANEDRGATNESPPPPRRTMGGSSTREAFRFQGFPDAAVKDVVPPDF